MEYLKYLRHGKLFSLEENHLTKFRGEVGLSTRDQLTTQVCIVDHLKPLPQRLTLQHTSSIVKERLPQLYDEKIHQGPGNEWVIYYGQMWGLNFAAIR